MLAAITPVFRLELLSLATLVPLLFVLGLRRGPATTTRFGAESTRDLPGESFWMAYFLYTAVVGTLLGRRNRCDVLAAQA